MTFALILLSLAAPSSSTEMLRLIAESGRVVEIATPARERLAPPPAIPPGAPPLLSFRLFEGKDRSRYANLDLVVDDAGH